MNPDISLHPLDMGFDIRLHDQPVVLSPKISAVKYETQAEKPEDRQTKTASGSYHEILTELQANGFQHIVADQTPNGRYIQFASGKYVVQPENDNYFITCDSLEDAHREYYRGQTIRYHDNDMPMWLHRRIKTAAAAAGKSLKALVRAVWPNSQREFERLCDEGRHPNNAAFYALDDVDGLTWSFFP